MRSNTMSEFSRLLQTAFKCGLHYNNLKLVVSYEALTDLMCDFTMEIHRDTPIVKLSGVDVEVHKDLKGSQIYLVIKEI